jgi:hypothetical protein
MEILRTSVRFGTGQAGATSHLILDVMSEKVDFGIEYTIVYQGPAGTGEYELHLLYDPSIHTLRLKNRPQALWQLRQPGELEHLTSASRSSEARRVG